MFRRVVCVCVVIAMRVDDLWYNRWEEVFVVAKGVNGGLCFVWEGRRKRIVSCLREW